MREEKKNTMASSPYRTVGFLEALDAPATVA